MSPTKIVDLDAVLGEDKLVSLGGKTYRLPPDIPVELWLKFTRYSGEGLSDEEMITRLYDGVLSLFRYGDPKLKDVPLSMAQLVQVIGQVYGEEGETEQARPTKQTNGASPRRSRPKKSRSSTS
jgi:hypothetical protein